MAIYTDYTMCLFCLFSWIDTKLIENDPQGLNDFHGKIRYIRLMPTRHLNKVWKLFALRLFPKESIFHATMNFRFRFTRLTYTTCAKRIRLGVAFSLSLIHFCLHCNAQHSAASISTSTLIGHGHTLSVGRNILFGYEKTYHIIHRSLPETLSGKRCAQVSRAASCDSLTDEQLKN